MPKAQTNQSVNLTATVNLKDGRQENVAGRNYTVLPCIALTEGVHNNLMWLSKEISKFPVLLDGRPVVVNHPMSASASTPEYFRTNTLGVTMNSRKHGAGIATELWIDDEKTATLGFKPMIDSINPSASTSNIMNVSCGIYTDLELKDGKWNDENYDAVCRNIRYDHLAILPDEEGACNELDGCGVRWNSSNKKASSGECCDSCANGGECELNNSETANETANDSQEINNSMTVQTAPDNDSTLLQKIKTLLGVNSAENAETNVEANASINNSQDTTATQESQETTMTTETATAETKAPEGVTLTADEAKLFEQYKADMAEKAKAEAAELETLRKAALEANPSLTMAQLSDIADKDLLAALKGKDKDMEEDKDEDMADDDKESKDMEGKDKDKDMKDKDKKMSSKDSSSTKSKDSKSADYSINNGATPTDTNTTATVPETSTMLRKFYTDKAKLKNGGSN